MKKAKAKIKKVMKGLQKASKTHAAQAKTLKGVLGGCLSCLLITSYPYV